MTERRVQGLVLFLFPLVLHHTGFGMVCLIIIPSCFHFLWELPWPLGVNELGLRRIHFEPNLREEEPWFHVSPPHKALSLFCLFVLEFPSSCLVLAVRTPLRDAKRNFAAWALRLREQTGSSGGSQSGCRKSYVGLDFSCNILPSLVKVFVSYGSVQVTFLGQNFHAPSSLHYSVPESSLPALISKCSTPVSCVWICLHVFLFPSLDYEILAFPRLKMVPEID